MKIKSTGLWAIAICLVLAVSCDLEPEAIDLQPLKEYSDEYYANLRAYKKTEHTIFYGWYAAYAPIEGIEGYKDPASWGERIIGIPDSVDIVSLWMGIPGNDPNDPESYAPIAYADWKFTREVKGTRFVATNIVRLNKTITIKTPLTITYPNLTIQLNSGDTVNLRRTQDYGSVYLKVDGDNNSTLDLKNDSIRVDIYTEWLSKQVVENELDGLDIDYEPEGDRIANSPTGYGEPMIVRMVKRASKYFGPMSDPALNPNGMIFCIDFYNGTPPDACGQYVDYYIRQAYTQNVTSTNATRLQNNYNTVRNAIGPEKFIVTENLGTWFENGGSPFTEADGNTTSTSGGQMYSLEGMARWNPTQGKKAGFGAFYFGRDYYSSRGPYFFVRQAIQVANPAGGAPATPPAADPQ